MPLISRERLFHPRVIKEKLSTWRAPNDFEQRRQVLASWANAIADGSLYHKKESSIDRLFLIDVFEKVLGYSAFNNPIDGRFLCAIQERTSPHGTCDGALGYFYTDHAREREQVIMVPIEAKDGKDDLDHPPGAKGRSPVQQLFDYLNDCDHHARFGILTNFTEIRLYSRQMGWGRYEVFLTQRLFEEEAELRRFMFLLGPDNMLWRGTDTPPRAVELLSDGEVEEQNITKQFYKAYKDKREALFTELEKLNPEVSREVVLEKTQKVLDRVLFILFAEDRGLLPSNTYRDQMNKELAGLRSWDKLSALFRALDKGDRGIHRYNGKLFEPDLELDALFQKDDVRSLDFKSLADHDFDSEVSVRVLGHVLEQSISDIEEKKAIFKNVTLEKGGKRKRDGVYYTPPFITAAIVAKCIGGWLDARRAEIEAKHSGDEVSQLLALRDKLDGITVLDPACGSGAFLVEALKFLTDQQLDLDARIRSVSPEKALTPADLGMEQAILKGNGAPQPASKRMDLAIARRVLERNLFGVDINPESVEITKLSLWLQTAEYDYFLTDLSPNIRVGDSLIPDPAVSKLAFNWQAGFGKVVERGGFDVIVGNPPYVKLQTFRRLMPKAAEYLRAHYKSCESGNFDMYLPFIEQGLDLLHPAGLMGYIAPSLWLKNDYGRGLKQLVKERQCLRHWVDFGWQQVFEDATTYTALQYFGGSGETFTHCRARLSYLEGGMVAGKMEGEAWEGSLDSLGPVENPWALLTPAEAETIAALQANSIPLADACGGIHVGLQTSANEIYHLKKLQHGHYENGYGDKVQLDDELILPLLGGEELERYAAPNTEMFILFPYEQEEGKWKLIPWRKLPDNTQKYFKRFEKKLRGRESGKFDGDGWYQLYPKNIDKQHLRKLCNASTVKHLELTIDGEGGFALDDRRLTAILEHPEAKYSAWYLLGVLNSPSCDWIIRFFAPPKMNGFFEADKLYLSPLPIPRATPKQQKPVIELAKKLTEGYTKLKKIHGDFLHTVVRDLLPFGVKPSRVIEHWHEPDFTLNTLRAEARKAHAKGDKKLERKANRNWDMFLTERNDWEDALNKAKEAHGSLLAQLAIMERQMNTLVYSLYGLSEEQIALIESGHPLDIVTDTSVETKPPVT